MKRISLLLFIIPCIANTQTPVYAEGFECGITGTGSHIPTIIGNPTFSTSTVRSGARSLRINPTGPNTCQASLKVVTTSGMWVIRTYVRFATLPNTNVFLIGVNGAFGLWFNSSDNTIRCGRNVSAMTASGIVVTTGQWYKLDIKIDITGTGPDIDGKVNGSDLVQYDGNLGSASYTSMQIGSGVVNSTQDAFYDDILASHTSGDYPLSEGYVNHFIPTSDDTHNVAGSNDFERSLTGTDILNGTTTAFQLIDDVPLESGSSVDWINMVAPVNATDYVACIFGPAPGISTPTFAPRAVEIIAGIHQAGTGTGNMVLQFSDGTNSSNFYDANAVAGTTTVIYKLGFFATRPGGGAWTLGAFNTTRIRFVASSGSVDANPDQYLDCIMIEAEFRDPRRVTTIY